MIFSIGFQILKMQFFQIALKTCETWSKWHYNSFFFQKIKKKLPPAARGFAPVYNTLDLYWLAYDIFQIRRFRKTL